MSVVFLSDEAAVEDNTANFKRLSKQIKGISEFSIQ